ncbi:MAG: hypothetical protein Q4D62_12340 [Planctomycetia bacterium]|nr:hypothetical protein [Planctomycetia bacterium]
MKFSRLGIFRWIGLGLFVSLCGCAAQNQQSLTALEQENAMQRERIWKSNLKMEDFRRENEILRQQIAYLETQIKSPGRSTSTPSTGGSILSPTPRTEPQATRSTTVLPSQKPISKNPPAVELGTPSQETPAWLQPENGSGPMLESVQPPTGNLVQLPREKTPVIVRKVDSSAVYTVQILQESVQPIHYEGIHVEFQMKDAQGNPVLAAAPVVLMVTDPSRPEKESRISKWVYSPEEIAEIINSGQAGLTIPLNMAWEQGCPENLQLEVHLLYQTSDKRLLMSRVSVQLAAFAESQEASLAPSMGHSAELSGSLERPTWSPNP